MPTKLQTELNKSLIDFILKNMFFPMDSAEAAGFHAELRDKIKALNPASKTFDTDWKHLLLGGAIAELVILSTKYTNRFYYPYTLRELMIQCGANPGRSIYNEDVFACVDEIGRQILAKKLPLEIRHLTYLLCSRPRKLATIFAEIIEEYDLDNPSALEYVKNLPETSRCLRLFDSKKTWSIATGMPVDGEHVTDEAMAQTLSRRL